MSMFWRDTQLSWEPEKFGGISMLSLNKDKVWRPTLSLDAQIRDQDGSASETVWLNNGGNVFWIVAGTFGTSCDVNVRKYPFDMHECEFSFMSTRYVKKELIVYFPQEEVNRDNIRANGEWELVNSNCFNVEHTEGITVTGFSCTITIKRRPAFVVIHMGVPLLFLTFLILTIFWVPVDCVERISLSVTLFLAFSVLVSGFTEEIPRNSAQVPLYTIALVFLNIVSSATVVLSIITVRLERSNDTNVPGWVRKTIAYSDKSVIVRVHPKEEAVLHSAEKSNVEETTTSKISVANGNITWSDVAKFIDRIAFIVVTVSLIIMTIVLLVLAFVIK